MIPAVLAVWMPGPIELVVIGGIALLVFGRRLPEVARSLGKSIVEFKRGIKDVKDDVDAQSSIESTSPPKLEQRETPAPKSSAPEASKERAAGTRDSGS